MLLADDHAIVLEGLSSLLSTDFELAGTVTDGARLIEAAERLRPDVIVTDITMPGMNGLEVLRRLQAKGTRSARRLLRKRRSRESRFSRDVNHRISKQLVSVAQRTGRGIALENLKGIRARIRLKRSNGAVCTPGLSDSSRSLFPTKPGGRESRYASSIRTTLSSMRVRGQTEPANPGCVSLFNMRARS